MGWGGKVSWCTSCRRVTEVAFEFIEAGLGGVVCVRLGGFRGGAPGGGMVGR